MELRPNVSVVTRFEYDEDASNRLHVDVVFEVEDPGPMTTARWMKAHQRLNAIADRLARDILALHRDCGTGTGPCDSDYDDGPDAWIADWGCETTRIIADHFDIEFPPAGS